MLSRELLQEGPPLANLPKRGGKGKNTMVRILLYLNFSNSCSGVDNRKYLHEGRDRAGIDAIAKANDEQDFVKREEIYAKYREALQHQIRFVLSFKIL